jgi:DNA-directed RNA polymerase specialized sigma24 family protein
MPEGIFERAYPVALRAAQVRAAGAVFRGSIPASERDDLEQEAKIACFRALTRFDSLRASLPTYMECVVASRTASFIRSAARRPIPREFNPCELQDVDPAIGRVELTLDVERVLLMVSSSERRLALLLMECTPTEASRALRVARSTVYEGIRRIRTAFAAAGFGLRRGYRR